MVVIASEAKQSLSFDTVRLPRPKGLAMTIPQIMCDRALGDVSNLPWNINLMGLQLWNSIRSCDWLSSLPDVDPHRIGCTGASGGTQTFMLMTIDDRIKAAAPVNMISAIMQDGCECENAPLLRLTVNNVEIASMMAPRPLLMVSATGDLTKHTLELEYPAVRAVCKLYNADDKLKAVRINTPHNYNLDSRNAVYPFFAKHLLKSDNPDCDPWSGP